MEGYRRIVVEVPVRIKQKLDRIAEAKEKSIKDLIIELVDGEYTELLREQEILPV